MLMATDIKYHLPLFYKKCEYNFDLRTALASDNRTSLSREWTIAQRHLRGLYQ